jgi:hypothetical protein
MKNNLAIYQCKRPVAAARIVDTYPEGIIDTRLMVEDAHGDQIVLEVGREWFINHQPHNGGYYVDFGEGHTGFCPAQAFQYVFALDVLAEAKVEEQTP